MASAPTTDNATSHRTIAEHLVATLATSLHQQLAPIINSLGQEHIALLNKREQKQKAIQRLIDNEEALPRSARLHFSLTVSKRIESNPEYINLRDEANKIINKCSKDLKTIIIKTAQLELLAIDADIRQHLEKSLCRTEQPPKQSNPDINTEPPTDKSELRALIQQESKMSNQSIEQKIDRLSKQLQQLQQTKTFHQRDHSDTLNQQQNLPTRPPKLYDSTRTYETPSNHRSSKHRRQNLTNNTSGRKDNPRFTPPPPLPQMTTDQPHPLPQMTTDQPHPLSLSKNPATGLPRFTPPPSKPTNDQLHHQHPVSGRHTDTAHQSSSKPPPMALQPTVSPTVTFGHTNRKRHCDPKPPPMALQPSISQPVTLGQNNRKRCHDQA
jgi:hypothetical protein